MADNLARLSRLRVLHLDERLMAKELACRALYYEQRQNDHLTLDWEGYKRQAGDTWLQTRQRGLGYIPATSESIPFGQRRPTCPTITVGYVVDTYTALLLGEGREPSVRVAGDEDTGALLEAVLEHSDSWSGLAEARTIAGARGAAAFVPEVENGVPSLRAMPPEHLYVEWASRKDWVPSMAIEQKCVDIEQLDEATGTIQTVRVWRTRAWDETYAYVYRDVLAYGSPAEGGDGTEKPKPDLDDVELAEPPIPHGAGRCPVIWLPNTRSSDDPIGQPDCEGVFEQVDQLDRLQSMIIRGSKANNDPTLVLTDKQYGFGRNQGQTVAKGYGQSIRMSEQGKAMLLEISGAAVETSWKTHDKVTRQIELRTGVMAPDAERSKAYQSGVALQILHRTQNTRAAARRKTLSKAIVQLCRVWSSMCRANGIKDVGAQGKGIEVPPREVEREDTGTDYEPHRLGPGGAIRLNWPAFHEATPQDLRETATALTTASGGQAVMSQETAVALMINAAQSDTDVATELERIRGEGKAKVEDLDDLMKPDVEGLADLDAEPTAPEPLAAPQSKQMADIIMQAGETLAPEAAVFVLVKSFPGVVDEAGAKAAIAAQTEFAEEQEEEAPEPLMVPAPGAASMAEEQDGEDVPEDREHEATED